MKTTHSLAFSALLSLACFACAAQSEGPAGTGEAASTGTAPSPSASCIAPDGGPSPGPGPDAGPPTPTPSPSCTPIATPNGSVNPAAWYCVQLGYTSTTDSQCAFPDGTACDEWAFYRGQCGGEHSFCALHGGTISSTTEDMGTWTGIYGVCTLPSGASCHEDTFSTTCNCP